MAGLAACVVIHTGYHARVAASEKLQ